MPTPIVILDACVLYPAPLRDLLLWLKSPRVRLHEKGDGKMARMYYEMMIEPGVAALCHAAEV